MAASYMEAGVGGIGEVFHSVTVTAKMAPRQGESQEAAREA
jgi:hypothetical protein